MACPQFSDMPIRRRHLPTLSEFIGRSSGNLYRNDDLSEMGSILHRREGFAGLSEGKDPVHYRMQPGLCDGPVHLDKMLPRAHVDAAYLKHLVKDRGNREGLLPAREHADLGNDA